MIVERDNKQSYSRSVYMDHASTTPLDPAVLEAMLPYLRGDFGNASSVHRLGRAARGAIEGSREQIAGFLNANPEEIVFTSGATEANNLALNALSSDSHLVTSTVEHKAVLEPAQALESCAVRVTYLAPGNKHGAPNTDQIAEAIEEDTCQVSIMYVNNETGAVAPIKEIASICRKRGVVLHTDAVQAAAWMPLDVEDLGVDMMSLSAHKMYGPKGVGILYVRSGVELSPQVLGGSQERGRRGGTENVAAAVGMAAAMARAANGRDAEAVRVQALRKELERRLKDRIGDQLVVNTPPHAAPHILSTAFGPVAGNPLDGEMLLLNMDLEGISASAGSACSSGAITPSHVLLGLGLPEQTARASLRLSLGRSTTPEDIALTAERIVKIVQRMRQQRVG
ncbi:MAG: cysteine desulfurase [Rhodothermaceae bacterium]|nr:cysteine desulfurase [Rhodothermaceae bacterium]